MNAGRFLKISAAGLVLPAAANEFVAVQDVEPLPDGSHRFWSTTEVKNAMPQPRCVEYAQDMVLAGFRDWRLPTRTELLTLVDDTRHGPAIDTDYFPGCQSDWYWTSTAAARSPGVFAWGVFFDYGGADWVSRYNDGWVRGVRVGQSLVVGDRS